MKILGAIIAGGKSSRMGQDKALMPWHGKALIVHVAERLAPQVQKLTVNANEPLAARLAACLAGRPIDFYPDMAGLGTPLAGLHAALHHAEAHGFAGVISAPCDTPLLPLDLRQRLEGRKAAIASSDGQAHFLHGFWPISLLPKLDEALQNGLFRVKDWVAACEADVVEWQEGDPFCNVNTPADFSQLT